MSASSHQNAEEPINHPPPSPSDQPSPAVSRPLSPDFRLGDLLMADALNPDDDIVSYDIPEAQPLWKIAEGSALDNKRLSILDKVYENLGVTPVWKRHRSDRLSLSEYESKHFTSILLLAKHALRPLVKSSDVVKIRQGRDVMVTIHARDFQRLTKAKTRLLELISPKHQMEIISVHGHPDRVALHRIADMKIPFTLFTKAAVHYRESLEAFLKDLFLAIQAENSQFPGRRRRRTTGDDLPLRSLFETSLEQEESEKSPSSLEIPCRQIPPHQTTYKRVYPLDSSRKRDKGKVSRLDLPSSRRISELLDKPKFVENEQKSEERMERMRHWKTGGADPLYGAPSGTQQFTVQPHNRLKQRGYPASIQDSWLDSRANPPQRSHAMRAEVASDTWYTHKPKTERTTNKLQEPSPFARHREHEDIINDISARIFSPRTPSPLLERAFDDIEPQLAQIAEDRQPDEPEDHSDERQNRVRQGREPYPFGNRLTDSADDRSIPPIRPIDRGHRRANGDPSEPSDSSGDDSSSTPRNRRDRRAPLPRWNRADRRAPRIRPNRDQDDNIPPRYNGPQFDRKLKPEIVDEWDGDQDTLVKWIESVNLLSERSPVLYRQLGEIIPLRLKKRAKTWFYGLPAYRRRDVMIDWGAMRDAICGHFMSHSWLSEQKKRAVEASYRDKDHPREKPTDYVYRKLELLKTVGNYTDRELIYQIMENAPVYWRQVIDTSRLRNMEDLQDAVEYHQRMLEKGGVSESRFDELERLVRSLANNRSPPKPNFFRQRNSGEKRVQAHLVGSHASIPKPPFPKDDTVVSKRTPESVHARPCVHCGSGKHWDRECKYAKKGDKKARTNMVEHDSDYVVAQEEYDELYYDSTDEEQELSSESHAPSSPEREDFEEPQA
jgi:hypothetical protein